MSFISKKLFQFKVKMWLHVTITFIILNVCWCVKFINDSRNTNMDNYSKMFHDNVKWTKNIQWTKHYETETNEFNNIFSDSDVSFNAIIFLNINNISLANSNKNNAINKIRLKRESNPLISTFDISKIFKKKKPNAKEQQRNREEIEIYMSPLKSDFRITEFETTTKKPDVTTTELSKRNNLQNNEMKTKITEKENTKPVEATTPTINLDKTMLIGKNNNISNSYNKNKKNTTPRRRTKNRIGKKRRKEIDNDKNTKRQDYSERHINATVNSQITELNTNNTKVLIGSDGVDLGKPSSSSGLTAEMMMNTKDFNLKPMQATLTPMSKTQRPKSRITKSSSLNLVQMKREPKILIKKNETLWPVKHAAVVEGDIVLGGLMMVHSRSEVATCGPVMAQGGVQALEVMLYALDQAATLAPPGVSIGAHILDDCDNDTYGLEMALDFIKGSISNIDDAEYACNATAVRKVISGVVGAASSVTSVQVANLLRLFKIPQVSFFSTSPELSNKARFEYFTRTIPSDLHQVRAMVEIVRQLAWTYVSIIYEESNYGIKAFEELETLLAKNGICIAVKERLVKDSGEADESAYDDIVAHLLTKPRARGVIIFGSDQEVAGVMAAVTRARATDAFRWVGSDGWSARSLVSDGNEEAVEGTISVQPQANEVKGFKEYFLGLTVENNKRNPWFIEFWEDHFRCRYPGSPLTPHNGNYSRCRGDERLSETNTEFEAQLQFVADAVMAFVYAIRDMHTDLCGGRLGLCEAMRPTSGPMLLKYLREVNFIGLSGDEFHFDNNGDGPARYNILHFKQVARGVYRWIKVGRYLDGNLELDMDRVQLKLGSSETVVSACSAECGPGQARQYVAGESCCWHCYNCTHYEIRSPESDTACVECAPGWVPDAARAACRRLPELHARPSAPAALAAAAFSAAGLLLTAFVGGVWVRHRSSALVRASGAELSLVLLGGVAACYLVTFTLILKPTDTLCAVQRSGVGLSFTVVYAALLTKTNRISRIFNASKHSAKRPSLISPKSQLVICALLVFMQVVIVVVWQIVSPARVARLYPPRGGAGGPGVTGGVQLVCVSLAGAGAALALAYPAALLVACTLYAVLTRKIPEAFNESKHIGFTMYTTCVIWLAFVPLYFGTASHVPLRVISMSVTISLSASVTLVCLFSPKLYIILVHPERNVRASLMPSRWGRAQARGGVGGGLGGAGALGAVVLPAPSDPTPSTDRSTLHEHEKSSLIDKYIQTENTEDVIKNPGPALTAPNEVTTLIDASKLGEVKAGLPNFEVANGRKINGIPDITVIGEEIAL